MTKNTLFAAAAMLLLPLAACDQKTETVTTQAPDPQAEELAKAPKVELPPSIKASVTFRCKDNSLAYVDFMSGDKIAELRTEKDGAPKGITLAQPGKPSQACKI